MALVGSRPLILLPRNLHSVLSPQTFNPRKISFANIPATLRFCSISFKRSSKITSLAEEVDFEEIQKEEYDGGSHVPVMLSEVLRVFEGRRIRKFVDCTLGAGGHSSAIIRSHPEMQQFVGLDVDPCAHEQALPKLQAILNDHLSGTSSELKSNLVCDNFRNIASILGKLDPCLLDGGVDGILMDLGMSSMQVDSAERGFSVLYDGPLDMRMSPMASLKAEDIVNDWPERELGDIIRDYGQEKRWKLLQRKIAEARLCGGLHSTSDLVEVIRNNIFKISGRQGWLKTAIRVFQALRIAVNDELRTLETALSDAFSCLASKGRLAVISFHSLEDRIVKQSFLDIINTDPEETMNKEIADDVATIDDNVDTMNDYKHKRKHLALDSCIAKEAWITRIVHGKYGRILTKKPITPSAEEESMNRRCRSAKLRVIEKY